MVMLDCATPTTLTSWSSSAIINCGDWLM